MRRWILYALGLLVVGFSSLMPFRRTDVAELKPVELICVSRTGEQVRIETDTGDWGTGSTVEAALKHLKATTAGDVFLETADHLLVCGGEEDLIDELAPHLRPACSLCELEGTISLEEAAAYLNAHKSEISLQDRRSGDRRIPVLQVTEGRMELVQ